MRCAPGKGPESALTMAFQLMMKASTANTVCSSVHFMALCFDDERSIAAMLDLVCLASSFCQVSILVVQVLFKSSVCIVVVSFVLCVCQDVGKDSEPS